MTKKKPAAKKPSKPSIAPSVPVTTVQDLLECGVQLEARVAALEMKVATLEHAELMRLREANPPVKHNFSEQVYQNLR